MRRPVLEVERRRQRAQPQLGTSGLSRRRARASVSTTCCPGSPVAAAGQRGVEEDRSKPTLWPTMTDPCTNSSSDGRTLVHRRCPAHHVVGDPGEQRDEGRDGAPAGPRATGERPDAFAAAVLGRPDLGERGRGRRAARGLHVHHGEGHVEQWRVAGRASASHGPAAVVGAGAMDVPGPGPARRPARRPARADPAGPTRRGADRHRPNRKHEGVRAPRTVARIRRASGQGGGSVSVAS